MTDFELPPTFDEWPQEDQLEYLRGVPKKQDIMDNVFELADVDISRRPTQPLKKEQWARFYLALRETLEE